jgi:hypothetical protein
MVTVLPAVLPELLEPPELLELLDVPGLLDVPELDATVVGDEFDFEELLHPATNTTAAATTAGILHLLRSMSTIPPSRSHKQQ